MTNLLKVIAFIREYSYLFWIAVGIYVIARMFVLGPDPRVHNTKLRHLRNNHNVQPIFETHGGGSTTEDEGASRNIPMKSR